MTIEEEQAKKNKKEQGEKFLTWAIIASFFVDIMDWFGLPSR